MIIKTLDGHVLECRTDSHRFTSDEQHCLPVEYLIDGVEVTWPEYARAVADAAKDLSMLSTTGEPPA